jgi:CubicO group peptidase (beta-lactamase class C family)
MRRALALALGVCAGPLAADDRPLDAAIRAEFAAGRLDGLHAQLVMLRGEVVAESYFDGTDSAWSRPLGMVRHGPDTLHDLQSITKSVTALLYGIALADGAVPPPEAPLLAQFPDYADLAGDPRRDAITIADALSMRLGLDWDESGGYVAGRGNPAMLMYDAPDPVRFALDRPMAHDPGGQWVYDSGGAEAIGRLIADGTGMALQDYASARLFRPLGITRWQWQGPAGGAVSAGGGLRLTARDLARIGQLVLQDGVWEGRQLVPAGWLDQLMQPRAALGGIRYGWYWWLADATAPRAWVSLPGTALPADGGWPAWVGGIGNGGQRLQVQRDVGLVAVTFAGRYNDPDDWRLGVGILERLVAPEVRRRAE